MNNPMDMDALRKMAWNKITDRLESASASIRSTVRSKRSGQWPSEEDTIKNIEALPEKQKRELLDRAFTDIQQRVLMVALQYIETQGNPEAGIEELRDAAMDLMVGLHNPQTREALLLCVKDEYRDDVRERFDEFGSLFWGISDINTGDQTDDLFFLLDVVAANKGITLEEVIEEVEELDASDVPDEYLTR